MSGIVEQESQASPPASPEQQLACGVLAQAFKDLKSSHPRVQMAARGWLCHPSPGLAFWCAVAGMPQDRVISAYWRRRFRV